ncbi:hypothetical protein [Salibacterium aidingense]|uniref:hypothetical protein n=1 Tax=Salibacterium aidingense TaxID=384933 RepID=UPI003BD6DF29
MKKILYLLYAALLIAVFTFSYNPSLSHASSSAIATGEATEDGRPVAWKNRDHWSTPDGWKVYPFYYEADSSSFGPGDSFTSRFNYVGATAEGESGKDPITEKQVPWAGANEQGLGLVQVHGHTLTSDFAADHGYPVSQDLDNGIAAGLMNHILLSRAEHVDEVEQILWETNDGGGFNNSFARNTSTIISVFDRWGNAAIFEIDGDSFTRDNITEEYIQDENGYYSASHEDSKGLLSAEDNNSGDSPNASNPEDGEYSGYDWRTNFSKVEWTKSNGFPYFVDEETTDVVDNEVTAIDDIPNGVHDWNYSTSAVKRHTRAGIRMDDPHPINYEYFIQKEVGSHALPTEWYMESLSRSIGNLPADDKPLGWHLNRHVSTFGSVISGTKQGDPHEGKLTTMWIALGEPSVSVFVPVFPFAGDPPDVLDDMYLATDEKRQQVYEYDGVEACGYSCGRNNNSTADLEALAGKESDGEGYYGEGGIQNNIFKIEDWIFNEYESFMDELRNNNYSDDELEKELADWQKGIAEQARTHYEEGTVPQE